MSITSYLFFVCIFLALIAFINIIYLKHTKLKEAEMIFRGREIMTANFFTAGLACLQYGGAFVSEWMAKRSHMLEARSKTPSHIKKYFIFHFWLFMGTAFFMFILVAFSY